MVNQRRKAAYTAFSRKFLMLAAIGLILIGLGGGSLANMTDNGYTEGNTMPAKTIKQVLKEHTKDLMSLPGVVGTAQGLCDDKPCIKIFVIEKKPELDTRIPENLEGYPVSIEETGEIRARPKDQD